MVEVVDGASAQYAERRIPWISPVPDAARMHSTVSRKRGASSAGPPRQDRRSGGSRHLPDLDPTRLRALGLSRREIAVLELVAHGRTNEQVGLALRLSPLTVKKHLERMYAKVGVGNRAALVAAVWQRSAAKRL